MKNNFFVYAPDIQLQVRIAEILIEKGYPVDTITPEYISSVGNIDVYPYVGFSSKLVDRAKELAIEFNEITLTELLNMPDYSEKEEEKPTEVRTEVRTDGVFVHAPDKELQKRIAQILIDKGYGVMNVTPKYIEENDSSDFYPYIGIYKGLVDRFTNCDGSLSEVEITLKEMLELPDGPNKKPSEEPEYFDFGEEFLVNDKFTLKPIAIGFGLAPDDMYRKCLVLSYNYDLEVSEHRGYKILAFKKKQAE